MSNRVEGEVIQQFGVAEEDIDKEEHKEEEEEEEEEVEEEEIDKDEYEEKEEEKEEIDKEEHEEEEEKDIDKEEDQEKMEEVSDVPTPVPGFIDNETDGRVTDVIRRLSSLRTSTRGSIAGQTHLMRPPPYYDSGSQDSFSRSGSISDTLANQPLETTRRRRRRKKKKERPNDGGPDTRAEEEHVLQSSSKKNVQWVLNSDQLRHSIRSPPPDISTLHDVIGQLNSSSSSPPVKLASSLHKSNRSSRVSFQDGIAGDDVKDNLSAHVYKQYEQRVAHIRDSLNDQNSQDNRAPNVLHKLKARLSQMRGGELPQEHSGQPQYAFKNEKDHEPMFDGQDLDSSRFKFNNNPEGFRHISMSHSPKERLSQPQIARLRSPRRSSLGFQTGLESSSGTSSSSTESESYTPPALEAFRKLDKQLRELESKISDVSTKHEFSPPSIRPDFTPQIVAQSNRNKGSSRNSKANSQAKNTPRTLSQHGHSETRNMQPQFDAISNAVRELETQMSAVSTQHKDWSPPSIESDNTQRNVAQSQRSFLSKQHSGSSMKSDNTQRSVAQSQRSFVSKQHKGSSMTSHANSKKNTPSPYELFETRDIQPQFNVISRQGSSRNMLGSAHHQRQFQDYSFHGYIPHSEQDAQIITRDASRMDPDESNASRKSAAVNSTNHSRNPMQSIHPFQNPLDSIHCSQNPLDSINCSQNPLDSINCSKKNLDLINCSQNPINASIHPSQRPVDSIHRCLNPINSIHPSQNPLDSIHRCQNPINSTHPSQDDSILKQKESLPKGNCSPKCGKEQFVCCYAVNDEQELRNRHPCCSPSQSQMMCCRQVYQPQSYCEAMMPPQVLGALICVMVFLICWILVFSFFYDVNILPQSKTHRKFNSNSNGNNRNNTKKTNPLTDPAIKLALTEQINVDTSRENKKIHEDNVEKEPGCQDSCENVKEAPPNLNASLCSSSLKWLAYTLHECSEHN